ncbi:MAG: bifunctional (p)ppGpp synthetase/guanosine-3',5'-bis(diphosphate) 3'-pyrophosphohydrolase [Gammaproteobacteria bacterium]|nr:bifunctional (p)ppGpp synthetase/guanosine-3',5'-bis(diphosphate) 3'-pyrophosphohydrolase [Gammaproteobacteria bacterium]
MKTLTPDGWLQKIRTELNPDDFEIIKQAISLAQLANEDNSSHDQPHIIQSVMTAEILHQLCLDSTTLAAAILYKSLPYTGLTIDDIAEQLGTQVAKLIYGVEQMKGISEFYRGMQGRSKYQHNIDNIRKMFLAMVDDIRVVLIKLAEQLCILRQANILPEKTKYQLATETMAIYAPLTNRLGIAQIKWELEDLAFKYLEPEKHQEIALSLEQNFPESSEYIKEVTSSLQTMLLKTSIKNFHATGRAKHIYSIHRKMNRKKIGLEGIYDVSALRIFVPTITDCYTALSLVHNTWKYLPDEFDDYIAAPKPNGYRSIHTAVYGPKNRVIEIQIRTHDMHHQAELGVAAHWVYKEGKQEADYQTKLSWLRQVMDWQQEIATSEKNPVNLKQLFSEYIYVFTPEGDILELPTGATPLDFAYNVHSEVGNHCVGAKINNNIVPLTYKLKTGDRVEILTSRASNPSRDWLISSLGFINTPRARSKILHWFRKQSQEHNVIQGQELLNKESRRLGLNKIDIKTAADKLHFKTTADLLAALGASDLKFSSILNALEIEPEKTPTEAIQEVNLAKPSKEHYTSDINIQNIGNLLIHTANCCKPIPGEDIVGYITQGRGIAIHRADCTNALNILKLHSERFIAVSWGNKTEKKYPVDIVINAFSRQGLVRDITNILSEEKILVTGLDLITDKKENTVKIKMTIEISGLNPLSQILNKISRVPNIIEIYRED